MHILEVNHGGGEIHRHFLLPGQTYTLGRKECRILLPAAEPSISRHHATIVVSPMPRCSVLDPSAQLEIKIEDVSKHGTFVDRERVGKDNTRFLYPEDRIRFGLRVTARIIPMMLVVGISPDLTDEGLDLVLDAAVHIGALVVEDAIPAPQYYYERHTNCVGFLYVAEDNFVMEETMMQALGYGYTLVTPGYIAHLAKALEEKETLMPSEFPGPSSPAPASVGLRAVHYRRPAQTFFSVREFLSIGRPIVASVFQGYTFLVLDEGVGEAYNDVLQLFGGKVEALALEAVPQWRLQHPQTGAYPLTTCALLAEGHFRAISETVMERGGGRGDFNTRHDLPTFVAYLSLYRYGVCLIPEENIHLALYRNDGKELNTKKTACYLQRTSEDVLADTTPASSSSPTAVAAPSAPTAEVVVASEPVSRKGSGPSLEGAAAAGQRCIGPTRGPQSPLTAPPASSNVSHLVSVQARRSRENSFGSAPSTNSAEGTDKSSAAAAFLPPASASNAPVIAGRSRSRAGSPAAVSAPLPAANGAPSSQASAQKDLVARTAETAQPTAAPVVAAAAGSLPSATSSSPPRALDGEALKDSAAAAVPPLKPVNSGSTSTAPLDANSATISPAETPTAVVKPSTTSSATLGSTTGAAPSPADHANAVTSSSSPTAAEENCSANREAALTSDSNAPATRSRLSGRRGSHPFSLVLRPRYDSGERTNIGSEDDEGEAQGSERRASSTAEINGGGGEEEAQEDGPAASPPTRPTTQSSVRRASASRRRPSLGAPPSPVNQSLKNEEVVRPRTRANSNAQQTAYTAALVAQGRRSVGQSEERPPLAPSEEGQHLISMEEAQRRSSGSMELSNPRMPPLPPATAPATTTTTTTTSATAGAAATAAASSAPFLQRVQPKTAGHTAPTFNSASTAPITTATPPESEKAVGNNRPGVTPTHVSVRRGEQRLTTAASVPTPRRSVVRVNPSLTSVHVERSASPPQSYSKLRRYTTPERDVVVHGAVQVAKSPPRQRVEAVRITNAASARRTSVPRDREASVSFHVDPEEAPTSAVAAGGDGSNGSMGDRRSVLRRESVSAVNRPPPASGPATRRASSSFQRSDSAQRREKATPLRLGTSRVSQSVPRTGTKVYSSVQRQRSLEPAATTAEEAETGVTNVSGLPNAGSPAAAAAAAAQRGSIRRRRGSPMPGNGSGAGPSSQGHAMPGQIPGLRGSSSSGSAAPPVLGGPSNAANEAYFGMNDALNTNCQAFMKEFIDDFMGETERVTRSVVRQAYMDAPSKETLESGVERVLEFLQYLNSAEADIPSMYSTSNTRAACHQVRQKSQYTLSKIKVCYKMVNCKIPSSLTRARTALSTLNGVSTQRRLNSVAVVPESGSVRRQNAS
ncbi:hypothetical protein ABB37_06628 [Leptomonas pyrrhocoris]|uniref:FHA domain-containing protein n=1 Tax=Leptomonas pyrrhocoris TaxID=157538 RepID=A0A0M9FX91_LEPPY|nr:hypothetical protein ABB37_06628 [Leptomonas pyrrhocoris]KPA77807.1 hypothetical protein ABB37_06628 [Leptomonas pyrrhocoris]|eukprot:XP_015656246.1 hypothetical protein ABB37_06628 [Leptomonas pyrrhocoris]